MDKLSKYFKHLSKLLAALLDLCCAQKCDKEMCLFLYKKKTWKPQHLRYPWKLAKTKSRTLALHCPPVLQCLPIWKTRTLFHRIHCIISMNRHEMGFWKGQWVCSKCNAWTIFLKGWSVVLCFALLWVEVLNIVETIRAKFVIN